MTQLRYAAAASCAGLLPYFGLEALSDQASAALPLLLGLAALGALLAGDRRGPALCVAAGGVSAIFLAIPFVIHPAVTLIWLTGVVAAVLALALGWALVRRQRAESNPT